MDEYIRRMNRAGIRYLLIGGQAMRLEGMPRFSMDWDFFIPARDNDNFAKINAEFSDIFDLSVEPLGPHGEGFVQTYQTPLGIIQFHLAPPGLPDFDEAERHLVIRRSAAGTPVRCLSGKDLLTSKQATNRPKDNEDIEFLKIKLEKATRETQLKIE